ncbi:RidA family protein [Mesorhizobium sp. 43Arga]
MLSAVNAPGTNCPGLSQGIILKGNGIFVSGGHVGTDASGEPIITSMEDQIVALFENLKRTLAEAGLGFEHVARTTCFVVEFGPELLKTIKEVRSRYYNADCPPASVMVQAGLYDSRLYAEIEVLAVVPDVAR